MPWSGISPAKRSRRRRRQGRKPKGLVVSHVPTDRPNVTLERHFRGCWRREEGSQTRVAAPQEVSPRTAPVPFVPIPNFGKRRGRRETLGFPGGDVGRAEEERRLPLPCVRTEAARSASELWDPGRLLLLLLPLPHVSAWLSRRKQQQQQHFAHFAEGAVGDWLTRGVAALSRFGAASFCFVLAVGWAGAADGRPSLG